MRWFFGGLAALIILVIVYVGSAVVSLGGLADAVRSGDGAGVIARTDFKSLTQSLVDQIVAAYLERIGQTREIRPSERMLVRAAGLGIADAMIAKMLTPDHLTQLLKTGKLEGVQDLPPIAGLPRLGTIDTKNVLATLGRFRFVEPVEFAVRISDTTDADSYSEIRLHFAGSGWQLAGLVLPGNIVRELAATLPVK
ncbi:DUF2939 domain-containing protein [Rhodopseudomonas sp. BR0C11]|uniref:DUF2939 domain-containing protein n=1 Tax=Rhodopseudomonas sp. BR0C11 TaxID=2269370 RepID=UPI0013DED9E0|nr:DUF2939 domain-containing protein [Rhodopseudomonas sp. BR0C11]NEV78889.1 DUF2939 domain-containing protein [Rhodopseudomonas sp. BR0C11]